MYVSLYLMFVMVPTDLAGDPKLAGSVIVHSWLSSIL